MFTLYRKSFHVSRQTKHLWVRFPLSAPFTDVPTALCKAFSAASAASVFDRRDAQLGIWPFVSERVGGGGEVATSLKTERDK